MDSAAFLLVINFSVGLSFAVAFLALTWRSGVGLGLWCAAGFVCAAATVTVEGFAFLIPSVRLVSAASFTLLMLALTLIAAGLARHYRPETSALPFLAILVLAASFNLLVVFDLRRGSWGQSFGYQLPFAGMLALAAVTVLRASARRAADLALAAVLILSALQFVLKAVLAALAGSGHGVRDYLVSSYAFYSQTAGGVLSICLGLALVGVTVTAVMDETKLRLQHDGLSGLLNRAAFLERAMPALRAARGAPSSLILCDLDHFKSINDRFGHAAGDEVIRLFAARLRAASGGGLTGRLGGEEFCILMPGGGAEAAVRCVEAIQVAGRGAPYALVPPEVDVTASFGIALTDGREPLDATLRRADFALYAAKAAGRDGYRFAEAAV